MSLSETLSQYSDWSYNTAAGIYLLAMVLVLIEQSFGKRARYEARQSPARARELIGAGAGVTTGDEPAEPVQAPPSGRPERFGRMGTALIVLGAVLHLAALVLRGLAAGRVPWGNMYEYNMTLCLVAVVAWLVVLYKYRVRHLSAFALLPVVILMFIGGTALYTSAASLEVALNSYWLVIHVSAAAISSGLFLVPGVASVLYLMRAAHDKNPARFGRLTDHLPPGEVLDRIAYRTTVLAFPLFTFGVLAGAIWAESAWGRFWGWDPKETVAFIAWVVYAGYLHARATAGWRGTRAAWVNVLGFSCTIFNLFFVNLVTVGFHSYAGVG